MSDVSPDPTILSIYLGHEVAALRQAIKAIVGLGSNVMATLPVRRERDYIAHLIGELGISPHETDIEFVFQMVWKQGCGIDGSLLGWSKLKAAIFLSFVARKSGCSGYAEANAAVLFANRASSSLWELLGTAAHDPTVCYSLQTEAARNLDQMRAVQAWAERGGRDVWMHGQPWPSVLNARFSPSSFATEPSGRQGLIAFLEVITDIVLMPARQRRAVMDIRAALSAQPTT